MTNNDGPLTPCEGCGATDECLYDCASRCETRVNELALQHPDMPRDELYRLDAHEWLEAHFTFDEQIAIDKEIERDEEQR